MSKELSFNEISGSNNGTICINNATNVILSFNLDCENSYNLLESLLQALSDSKQNKDK